VVTGKKIIKLQPPPMLIKEISSEYMVSDYSFFNDVAASRKVDHLSIKCIDQLHFLVSRKKTRPFRRFFENPRQPAPFKTQCNTFLAICEAIRLDGGTKNRVCTCN